MSHSLPTFLPKVSAVVAVSVLLGVSIAATASAFADSWGIVWGDSSFSRRTAVGVALLALAAGVRVPQRFAMWCCAVAWYRFVKGGGGRDAAALLASSAGADRPLRWTVLSLVTLTGGVATALLPFILRLAMWAYHVLLTHFVWSAPFLVVLQTFMAFFVLLIPLAATGLATSLTHRLSHRHGQWDIRVTAWLLLGAAVALLAKSTGLGVFRHPDLALVVASLPALLASLVAIFSATAHTEDAVEEHSADSDALPSWSDPRPKLLRACIVAVGGGAACAITAWMHMIAQDSPICAVALPVMLLALAAGILCGTRNPRSGGRSLGGFGISCITAGVLVTPGVVTSSVLPWAGLAPSLLASSLCLAAIGFADAYGRRALLDRVTHGSGSGPVILTRTLACCAVTVMVGVPLVMPAVGAVGTLLVLSFSLLLLGAAMLVYEPMEAVAMRRVRVLRTVCFLGAVSSMSLKISV